jgi:hypothetical protein
MESKTVVLNIVKETFESKSQPFVASMPGKACCFKYCQTCPAFFAGETFDFFYWFKAKYYIIHKIESIKLAPLKHIIDAVV